MTDRTDSSGAACTTVTVTYNCEEFLLAHLDSLRDHQGLDRFVHIDNASTDATPEMLATFEASDARSTVVCSSDNAGFGKSSNRGLTMVDTAYVLFLNPDVIFEDTGTVRRCIDILEANPEIGVLSCALTTADGAHDHAAKRGEPTLGNAFGHLTGLAARLPKVSWLQGYRSSLADDATGPVDAVNGAFMLMPTDLATDLGGFDEDFWMYGEDLDLCRRVRDSDRTVFYAGNERAIHLKGASDGGQRSPRAKRAFRNAMVIYRGKHGTRLEQMIYGQLRSRSRG